MMYLYICIIYMYNNIEKIDGNVEIIIQKIQRGSYGNQKNINRNLHSRNSKIVDHTKGQLLISSNRISIKIKTSKENESSRDHCNAKDFNINFNEYLFPDVPTSFLLRTFQKKTSFVQIHTRQPLLCRKLKLPN